MKGKLDVRPLTPARWADFEVLFGPKGACAGCWCMWWFLTNREFAERKGERNREAMKERVDGGAVPGLLAYLGGEPVGWCALGPRAGYARLSRSRILKPLDEEPVWSVVCFYVRKDQRRKGLTLKLLEEAGRYAKASGAKILEGYPVDPKKAETPPVFAYTGIASAFRRAGFTEAARRSETRPIMRKVLK